MNERLFEPGSKPEPVSYERKVVVFYDVLGWRDQIARAGSNPEEIGRLRRTILRPIQTLRHLEGSDRYRFSAFSDNIVISSPTDKSDIEALFYNMASFVLASVSGGYLIRGGITIGDIVHDQYAVFGPALNRAYELESKFAVVPRIVLDPNVLDQFGNLPFCISEEGGWRFVDPFSVAYTDFLATLMVSTPESIWQKAGFKNGVSEGSLDPLTMVQIALEAVKRMLRSPLPDKEYEKVRWLYDRIAKQLGVPPASSYPRVKPGA